MGPATAHLNFREYTTLSLDGNVLKHGEILHYCDRQEAAHFADLKEFIKDWLSPAPEIQIMTSGSTGTPKQIWVRKNDMLWSASQTAQFFNFQQQQRALLALPLSYIAGKMMVVRALYSGLDLILRKPSSQPLAALPSDAAIDFAPFTPMQLTALPDHARLPRTILLGGGPVSRQLETTLATLDAEIYHGYGMAETLSHIALRRVNGPDRSDDYTAFPSVTLRQDEQGRLCIRVPFRAEELVTNDVVSLTGTNSFRWLGRADHVINTGGIKVFPEEIESTIASYLPDPCFVAGVPDEVLGEKIVLFIERTTPLSPAEQTRLLDSLKGVLDKYQVPKEIHTITSFAATHSGKLQRGETLKQAGF